MNTADDTTEPPNPDLLANSPGARRLRDAIESDTVTMWTPERARCAVILYKGALNRLLASHPRDDDEGLAIKLSAFASSIGY